MDNSHRNVLDDDRIGRLLLKLSLPAFFGMLVTSLYNIVDTIFIGRYVGPLGIAGLSIVFPLQILSLGIGQLTGMGGASLISRLIGAGNTERAERVLGNAITATIITSLLVMIVGLSNTDFWLRLMGATETILPYARDYLTIILFGLIFQTLAMAANSLIRAEGNANVAMAGMIIGAVLNIILDAIFIIPLGMGIKGAALASLVAQLISVLYFARYYLVANSYLKIHLKNMLIELKIIKDIFAIGIASLTRTSASSLSSIIINRTLGAYSGDLAISAYGIANRIIIFAIMPGIVIGQGLQPILGFNYGAKRYDRALQVIKIAIISATAFSLAFFIILEVIPQPIVGIFTADQELIDLASHASRRIYLTLYLMGFIMVGSLIFQSIGKVIQSFITSISRPALFLLPSILILPHFLEVDGVWFSFPIAEVLTSLLTVIFLIPLLRTLRQKRAPAHAEPASPPQIN